jgi:hypothetical protein
MDEHDGTSDDARDPLAVPSAEVLRDIASRQDARAARAREIAEKRKQERHTEEDERQKQAIIIQSNWRGYRARRALRGYGLDSSTRWIQV